MRSQEAELDRDIAALLAAMAFTEVRHLAGSPQRGEQDTSHDEVLDRIRFLANLSHNLPGVARPRARRPSRQGKPMGSFDQAMTARPMSWVWNSVGPDARAWMLRHIEHRVRSIERDTSQWDRDHEAECAPQLCGFVPEATDSAPTTT